MPMWSENVPRGTHQYLTGLPHQPMTPDLIFAHIRRDRKTREFVVDVRIGKGVDAYEFGAHRTMDLGKAKAFAEARYHEHTNGRPGVPGTPDGADPARPADG